MVIEANNNLRRIRNILYNLKRTHGVTVSLYQVNTIVNNVETGARVVTWKDVQTVRRAIVLRGQELRDFAYDLAFIASNKNFTYGGFFDENTRAVIIESRDLTVGTIITGDDHLQFNDARWEVDKIFDYEKESQSYLLSVKALSSSSEVPVV